MDERQEILSAPLTFNWTLSYRCNFTCDHCYSRDEVCNELSTADNYRIIDVLAEQQIPFINFGGGEPLLRDDLFDIAGYATQCGLNVSMNSNGWLLDSKVAQRLRDCGFKSVGISIDSPEPTVHDQFRNMPGSFTRATHALDSLADSGLKSTMSSVVSRINYRCFQDLLDLARDHHVTQIYLHNFKCSGRGFKNRENLDLTPEEWQTFYREALATKERISDLIISFDDPVIASLPGYQHQSMVKGSSCGKLSLHLRPNGDIAPCGFIPVVVGNILKDDFETIWFESPVLKAMRSKVASGKCASCSVFEDCQGGCTARAFATTGDFNQPDPHCWK
ncbi:MAG: GeoRSP system radical SAM/SPASM protein [Deltaproteobacteria bacterium]|jgi:GeoRSP system radical SAM/SPASM protein|nr:GeoRSP system radical SAM/SPASM protein [Deltaproteobacteria bacterium]